MPRIKTQTSKEGLLLRVKRQRLKYIAILPSLVTLLNGLCGFAAIFFTSKAAITDQGQFIYHRLQLPYFALAGYTILLAMLADMLDGRLARMSKSTSSFGGQLDSLCDIISFGVAPAFLMLKFLECNLSSLEFSPVGENFLQRFIWLVAAVYLSCASIRLARFNVENDEDESAHMSFVGLPTPAASGVPVSLIIFHQEMLPELSASTSNAYLLLNNIIIYTLPFLVLGSAALMVSRIRYPHIINQYLKGKKPFVYLIRILLFLGFIIWSTQAALMLIFCGFAASGFLKWFYIRIIRRKTGFSLLTEQPHLVAPEGTNTDL